MRLFLVRHGESVDNVAGLYAGSRDSALTSHGVLQTRRLGAHLAAMASPPASIAVTHIFASDLQRAFLTASAVLDAQRKKGAGSACAAGDVVKLADLRERDFRSGEGARVAGGGRDAFADAESRDEMRVRAERFIDDHLHPLLAEVLAEAGDADGGAVVVVSHGIFLNVILTSLLQRYAPAEFARLMPPAPAGSGSQRAPPKLLMSWSNTGYMDIAVTAARAAPKKDGEDNKDGKPGPADVVASVRMQVLAVNCVEHLAGLKKTRGGIGSAEFDAKQKTMDAFFAPAAKRQKRQEE